MLSPSSAAEVCGADARRYNAGTVLPPGAFDVQSIRAAQTADPRAKQTRPSGPARRAARVNTKPGDGGSPGSMTAGRFHLGEVVGSFLGQPPLAGLPPLADGEERHRRGVCRCQLAALPHPLHGQPAHPSAQGRPTQRGYPGPSRMVRTIYQQLSPAEVHGQLDRVVEQLWEPFPQWPTCGYCRDAGRV